MPRVPRTQVPSFTRTLYHRRPAGMPTWDVVVIGTGIGGSAAAALLARAGLRVLALEKNPRVGGSCSYYEKRGFHIDYGTHMFPRGPRGPHGAVERRRLGTLPADRRIRGFIRTPDIAEVRGLGLNLKVPAAAWRMPRFLVDAVRALAIPARELPRLMRLFADVARMSDAELRLWDARTVDEFLLGYTENSRLFALLGFLFGLYFILPFWEVSAGEAIWCFRQMARDNFLSYPLGGSVAIPRAYCAAAERFGARIVVRAGTQAIEAAGAHHRVVTDDGKEHLTRAVVSTTSLRDLVRLAGPARFPAEYRARVGKLRGSYVAVQCKIALPRRRETAGALVGSVSRDPSIDPWSLSLDDFRKIFQDVENGRVPKVLPIYCPIPTNFDPGRSPRKAPSCSRRARSRRRRMSTSPTTRRSGSTPCSPRWTSSCPAAASTRSSSTRWASRRSRAGSASSTAPRSRRARLPIRWAAAGQACARRSAASTSAATAPAGAASAPSWPSR